MQAWRAALRHRAARVPEPLALDVATLPAARLLGRGWKGGYAIGVVTSLSNPKLAVFAFAFYPQVIPHGYSLLPTAAGLGLLQVAIETMLYTAFVLAVGRTHSWFSRTRVRARLDALTGTVLVALGVRLATESPA